MWLGLLSHDRALESPGDFYSLNPPPTTPASDLIKAKGDRVTYSDTLAKPASEIDANATFL